MRVPPVKYNHFSQRRRYAVIFDFFDADGDGNITELELHQISVPLYHLCFGGQQRDEEKAILASRYPSVLSTISDLLTDSTPRTFFYNLTRTAMEN